MDHSEADVVVVLYGQASRGLTKSRLTKAGDKSFAKTFTKTRKEYVDDSMRARKLVVQY